MLERKLFKNKKVENVSEIFSFINFENPLYFGVQIKVLWAKWIYTLNTFLCIFPIWWYQHIPAESNKAYIHPLTAESSSLLCVQACLAVIYVAIISALVTHLFLHAKGYQLVRTHQSLIINYQISARADGGPRSPSAHAWRFARPPIDTSGNFPEHMSAESPLNTSPNPSKVISEVSEP